MSNMKKIKIKLGPVQETMLIPLLYRALELKEENPIVQDEMAQQILEQVDYDFVQLDANFNDDSLAWPIRAATFDRLIKQFIEKNPEATIINLGSGLDTTFFRVDNGKIHWYDIDLEDSIALRRQFIGETDRLKFIASSAFDTDWFKEIKHRDKGVFIISAGMFIYFDHFEIQELISKMAHEFPQSELIFDTVSNFFRFRRFKKLGVKWGVWGTYSVNRIKDSQLLGDYYYANQARDRWTTLLARHYPYYIRPLLLLTPGMYHLKLNKDQK
ncbi:MAG: class I SAM-dependent methyltransferase [Gammaproteobacteria bacterium]|nr:class I SAM-dependent methyltransferase [Gammaproteobacteria bacterium]